ncbi:MAG: hypothetical protein Q4Q03_02735 [Bowdeniella nasicola]|nr:hypothetical protein [Bowdeniella nasicola]
MSAAMITLITATIIWALALQPPRPGPRPVRTAPLPPPPPPLDAAMAVRELAAYFRAGASLATAWRHTAASYGFDGQLAGDIPSAAQCAVLGEVGRHVHAGFLLAARTGAPLAPLLDACARSVEATTTAAAARQVAFAGPRASARILAWLPIIGLAASALIGIDVVGVLRENPIAQGAAGIGLACWVGGWWWSRRMVKAATDHDDDQLGLQLDLAAAALDSGASIVRVIATIGELYDDPTCQRAARGLRLGLSWKLAWAPHHRSALAHSLEAAWHYGLNPQELLSARAAHIRTTATTRAHQAAAKLGANLVLPLGLCYLPAFICLALIPTVIALLQPWWH